MYKQGRTDLQIGEVRTVSAASSKPFNIMLHAKEGQRDHDAAFSQCPLACITVMPALTASCWHVDLQAELGQQNLQS